MDLQNTNGAATKNNAAQELNGKVVQNSTATTSDIQPLRKNNLKPVALAPKPTDAKEAAPKSEKVSEPIKIIKPAMNLQATLKAVDALHRKGIQRVNLITRIKQLEEFEVKLSENDELEDNPYQGCKIIIEDDEHRRFITTTPGLIRMVAQYILKACHEKLAEIEAHIVFPNA